MVVGVCDADFARAQTAWSNGSAMEKPAFRLVDGRLVRRTAADRLGPVTRFLDEHSRIWMGLRQSVRWLGYRWPVK